MKRGMVIMNMKCVWFCSIFFRFNSHTMRSSCFISPASSFPSESDHGRILQTTFIDQKQFHPTSSPSTSPESISSSPPPLQEETASTAAPSNNSTDSSKQNISVDSAVSDSFDDVNNIEIAEISDTEDEKTIINETATFLSTVTSTNNSTSAEVNDSTCIGTESSCEVESVIEGEKTEKTVSVPNSEGKPISLDISSTLSGHQGRGSTLDSLVQKYKGRVVVCHSVVSPHINIYLCGTLHVAQTSADMVKDVIRCVQPDFVMLELCEARIDNLMEYEAPANLTFTQVVRHSFEEKSLKTFGMGLLTWMQLKAASVMGSKLGGELITAAKEAHSIRAALILGDRLYSVTIQRIFDRLRFVEKCKMVFLVIWEALTMSLFKIKDYIKKTEDDDDFVKGELERFAKHMPSFAEVIISERDEYLAQSLHQMAEVAHARRQVNRINDGGEIVAVVGAGHLAGIQRHLAIGKATLARIQEISASSKQPNTWPGDGVLHMVDTDILFSNKQ